MASMHFMNGGSKCICGIAASQPVQPSFAQVDMMIIGGETGGS